MKRLLTHLLLHVLLLSQLFVQGLGGGLVVCIGADGHSRLELAMSSCCETGPSAPHQDDHPGRWSADTPAECGSCTDQMIPTATRISRSPESFEITAAQEPADRDFQVAFAGEPPSRAPSVQAAVAPPRHLTLLAGVVLRC